MRPNKQSDFWKFVRKTDTCWLWVGATNWHGYGRFDFAGKRPKAHRFSWEMANGTIPAGLHVCHHCDNRLCVRPDHLFVGTHSDNMRDRDEKGRCNPSPGVRNGNAKLSETDVRAIREKYKDGGVRQVDLAQKYAIHQTIISKIVLRKNWKHI